MKPNDVGSKSFPECNGGGNDGSLMKTWKLTFWRLRTAAECSKSWGKAAHKLKIITKPANQGPEELSRDI